MAVTGDELDYYAIVATILSATVIAGVIEVRRLARSSSVLDRALGVFIGLATFWVSLSLAAIPKTLLDGYADYEHLSPGGLTTTTSLSVAAVVGIPLAVMPLRRLLWPEPKPQPNPEPLPLEISELTERLPELTPAPARSANTSAGWAVVALLGAAVAYVLGRVSSAR